MPKPQVMTETEAAPGETASGAPRPRLLFAAPVSGLAGLSVARGWGLTRDPGRQPSTLIGQRVSAFSLPPVRCRALGLWSADLQEEVSLVNFFPSWYGACRANNPIVMELARSGAVPAHAINCKDATADAARWLDTFGDPYTRTGADWDGRMGIEWCLYGVPQTYVVSAGGRLMLKYADPSDGADSRRHDHAADRACAPPR